MYSLLALTISHGMMTPLRFVFVFVPAISSLVLGITQQHFDKSTTSVSVSSDVNCTKEYSCLNCTAVQLCAPTPDGQSFYEIARFNCPTSHPWCNLTTGTCTWTQDQDCIAPVVISTNFTCMRNGYFPDPYNCSLFYHCKDEKAYQYTCTYPAPYYHPEYQYCVSYSYYCTNTSINCQYAYNIGTKVPISYTSNYFAYCLNDSFITVDRCIGAYVFYDSFQICVPYCPNAGLFPKDDNCANYYKCSPRSHELFSGYIMTDLTCPEGQGFLESEYSCVDRSLVPNCNVTYPDLFNK